jgi:integrase
MVGTLLSTSLAAGADLKVVQDQLGHSTITLTADTVIIPGERDASLDALAAAMAA